MQTFGKNKEGNHIGMGNKERELNSPLFCHSRNEIKFDDN